MRPISAFLSNAVDSIERTFTKHRVSGDLSTGFEDLDLIIDGLHKGSMVLVSGRPCIGKTTFVLDIFDSTLRIENMVAFISFDNSSEEMLKWMLLRKAASPRERIWEQGLAPEDWQQIANYMGALGYCEPYLGYYTSVDRAISKIRKLRKRFPFLDLVIVDGLNRAIGTPTERIQACRTFSALAKELKICILLTLTSSRQSESRANKRPLICDLAEADLADVVLFVHRESYYKPYGSPDSKAEIVIAKNKFGPTCSIELLFEGAYPKFRELSIEIP